MLLDLNCSEFVAAAMLRYFEGLRLAPYFCAAGRLSIGYGHVILQGEQRLLEGITEGEAEALLLRDLAWAMRAARGCGRKLTEGQEAALASLIFNIGLGQWLESTIRRLVVAGDMGAAARQFGRWVKVRGVVNSWQVKRRAAEAKIFEGETWTG